MNGYSTDGQSVPRSTSVTSGGQRQSIPRLASRGKAKRAQLRRLLSEVAAGDVLMVTRFQVARSTRDLENFPVITDKKSWFPFAR